MAASACFSIVFLIDFKFIYPLTSAIFVAQIREPPDVAQANRIPNAREDEFELTSPCRSLLFFLLAIVKNFGVVSAELSLKNS